MAFKNQIDTINLHQNIASPIHATYNCTTEEVSLDQTNHLTCRNID